MDRGLHQRRRPRPGVPRAGGDGPTQEVAQARSALCSPRERGWTVVGLCPRAVDPVFPARAGMDRPRAERRRRACCVPRASGDGPNRLEITIVGWGVFPARAGMDRCRCPRLRRSRWCSPRERGWTEKLRAVFPPDLVFPARAGMDRACRSPLAFTPRCSPRERGWTDIHHSRPLARVGVPRASGDGPLHGEALNKLAAVFPARAGMDQMAF